MRRLVTDERVVRFVSEQIGAGIYPPYTAVGIEDGDQIVAGVVFNCFTGANVEATVAGRRGAFTRSFLRAVGRYAFDRLQCERVTLTSEQNEVIDLAQRCGGRIEGVMRNFYGKGRDAVVVGILRDEWRFG